MNENERKDPGEAAGDGHAAHGYRNEVTWDAGKGRQRYGNRGEEEQVTGAAGEFEAGNAGETAGRNMEQLEEVKRKPERTGNPAPRGS